MSRRKNVSSFDWNLRQNRQRKGKSKETKGEEITGETRTTEFIWSLSLISI